MYKYSVLKIGGKLSVGGFFKAEATKDLMDAYSNDNVFAYSTKYTKGSKEIQEISFISFNEQLLADHFSGLQDCLDIVNDWDGCMKKWEIKDEAV